MNDRLAGAINAVLLLRKRKYTALAIAVHSFGDSRPITYLIGALHNKDRFWKGHFVFLKDGYYPIDNNLAALSET